MTPKIGQRINPPEPKAAATVPVPGKLLRAHRMTALEALKGLVAHAMTVRDVLNESVPGLGLQIVKSILDDLRGDIDNLVPHYDITEFIPDEAGEIVYNDVYRIAGGGYEIERCFDDSRRNQSIVLIPYVEADADRIITAVRWATANMFADTGDRSLDLAEAELWLELHEGHEVRDIFWYGR